MNSTVQDVMGAVRVKVTSPDGTITVHSGFGTGIRIECEPEDLRRHDASSLSAQLQQALNTLRQGALEAQRLAITKAFEVPSPLEGSREAEAAEARKRHGQELVDHIEVVETSRNDIVVLGFHARRGFQVRITPGVPAECEAETILADLNQTVGTVLHRYNAEIRAMHRTLMRELSPQSIEEKIRGRD